MSGSLRMRLGPFPNELDAVRSLHRRQDIATPDDQVQTVCAICYILDEGWPCTVARLIEVLDAQIKSEAPADSGHVLNDLDCWCRPYRDPANADIIIHRPEARS